METIKKVISLEQYKSRFNHKTPYINYDGDITSVAENNWGEIPCDYNFKTLDECSFAKIKDMLPLVAGVSIDSNKENVMPNSYCFRYKTMIYWYNWIINYGKSCKYYKLCKRGSEYIWRELNYNGEKGDFFNDFYGLGLKSVISTTNIPSNNEDYSIGDVIEVNNDAETFIKTFRVNDDDTRYELLVLSFIKDIFNDETLHSNLSIPFIDIPIHITQTIDSLGLLTSTAKEWDPRKTYMAGDIVLYSGSTYVLNDGDSFCLIEMTGGIYETFINYINGGGEENMYYAFRHKLTIDEKQTPKEVVYDEKSGKKIIYYDKKDDYYRLYFPHITHKAKIYEDKEGFIFNTKYWTLNSGNLDSFNVDDSGIIMDGELSGETFQNYYIKTSSDSKLISLRRYKKSVDEDGNILPFILDAYKTTDSELPYTTGIYNIYMGPNEIFRGDVMEEISIDYGEQKIVFKYIGNGITTIQTTFNKGKNENIDEVISLNNNINIYNIKELNTITYIWGEISKSTEKDETIEIVETLPSIEEGFLGKKYQMISYENNVEYYIIYECIEDAIQVVYSGETNRNAYITPSMLLLAGEWNSDFKSTIKFTYFKDVFLIYDNKDKTLKNYTQGSGLKYSETYPFKVSVAAINLTHDKNTEISTPRSYNLYDYELNEGDEVDGSVEGVDISDYTNVGKIYSVIDDNGIIIGYKRLLSEYNFMDINYDNLIYEVSSTDVENLKKNTILSKIEYSLENITKDEFQKDYNVKDEFTIGIEDVSESIDVNIERGLSSSFEKHHILCEIKSLSDLENYRNNLFKI